jgi:hypothetical protein
MIEGMFIMLFESSFIRMVLLTSNQKKYKWFN